MGAIPAARLYHTKYKELQPPLPHPGSCFQIFPECIEINRDSIFTAFILKIMSSFSFTALCFIFTSCKAVLSGYKYVMYVPFGYTTCYNNKNRNTMISKIHVLDLSSFLWGEMFQF